MNRRLTSLAEVLLIVGVIEYCLWILGPQIARGDTYAIGFWWMLVLLGGGHILWFSPMVLHRDPPSLRGWAWPREPREGSGQWRQAWPLYAGITLLLGLFTVSAGLWRDPGVLNEIDRQTFVIRFIVYILSGPVQALIFFGFIHTRLRTLIPVPGNGTGALRHQALVGGSVASLFAVLHSPNWPLLLPAFGLGLVWSWLFYQRPNVLLLGLCHAALGTLFHQFMRVSFRIGPFYLDPSGHILATVIPGFADLVGHRF